MKKIILSILLVLLISTTSSGFPPPASPGLNSVIGLWASGSCTGYLKSDGTCTAGSVEESDPIVGAITGLVKANGAGTISAASAGTDYVIPAGNVATATALAANPTNCSAGNLALGIDASGAAECTPTPSLQALTLTGTSTLGLGTGSTNTGQVIFHNSTNNNDFTVQPGATGATLSWTLPIAAPGGANYLLNVDADGTMGYTDPSTLGGGFTNLTDFDTQTAWRIFYSDGNGDVTELALGSDGEYLKSNGASLAPSWATPSGAAHDAVTLSTAAGNNLLSLSTQEIGLDNQTANYVFAGPASGEAAAPAFRALTSTDIPDLSGTYLTGETDSVVGAVTGIVKANGAGTISAASAGTDYQAPLSAGTDYIAPTSAVSVTLDDGSGDSPSLTFTDETNETATFTKTDSGYLGLTTVATDGLNVLVGNLKVGNGTPGQTINGEDAYIEGLIEVDGMCYFDGGATVAAGQHITVGTTQWDNGSDKIDGEQIADDTIDDDSIDFTDVTLADMTTGSGTAGNLLQDDGDGTFSFTSSLNLAFSGTTPEALFRDTDAAGAADDDEDAGSIKAQMTTTTEDGEVSDMRFTAFGAATAGTEYTWGWFDSSEKSLFLGVMTDADPPLEVADYEYLKFDFDTGTDAQIAISSVASEILFDTLNVRVGGTQFQLPSSNADPTATAGYLRHDSTITNFTNGGLVYYNGAAIKQLVDMTTATASACTDDQVVAYDADNDLWYCKDDSTGAGSLGSNLLSTTNDLTSDNNALQFVANSEDLVFTASANMWTLSSTTGAAITSTPAFTVTGLLTGNAGGVLGNGSTGAGFLRLLEDSDNGTDYSSITGAADAGTMPSFTFTGSAAGAEDLTLTATTNLWTFASSTSATFAFTPAVAFTAATTHNAGITVADAQTLTFDESAADPNDADIVMSAADGVLTIAAANGANNENLTLDFDATSNQVAVNTGTGVTAISLTAINLVTTGTIDGAIPMTGSTSATITVGGSSGWYYNADDDVIAFNLPATPTGKAYCFSNVLYARAITVNPDDSDYIVHAGTTAAQGEAYVSSGARTDQVCVVGIDASYWLVTSERGTWAEETP